MWYLYLRRDQHYLRSYRTHNLWLDSYAKKMRQPKINAWHVAVMRRMAKSTSGVRTKIHHPPTQSYGFIFHKWITSYHIAHPLFCP